MHIGKESFSCFSNDRVKTFIKTCCLHIFHDKGNVKIEFTLLYLCNLSFRWKTNFAYVYVYNLHTLGQYISSIEPFLNQTGSILKTSVLVCVNNKTKLDKF